MLDTKKIIIELNQLENGDQLENFFQKYLGKKGLLNDEFKKIVSLSDQEKKIFGKTLSDTKNILTSEYEKKENELSIKNINKNSEKDIIDISIETDNIQQGNFSIISKVRREIEEIYKSMGFIIDYGHEIVTKYENFESVNIPLTHPATESHDTIYLNDKDMFDDNLILRTHNSAHQVQDIQKYGIPLKLGSPGRVYRVENMDASHDIMFQYAEGIVIDKNISIANFKDTMKKLLSAILGKKIEIRMRPSYFPFVEPGFEIDAQCPICDGKGCSLCKKSGWLELLGAGMIHPNVLKNAGVDPKIWSGFAFGIGLSRLAAIRYGIKDIRYFTNGDLRFIRSFA
ncbi:MAG: phenylalanine--tRNA ligase subunit alpha [Candidatus Absconditabacterales bacterium]